MNHRLKKIILCVSALSILLAFPVEDSTGRVSMQKARRKTEMRKLPGKGKAGTNRAKPGMWGGEHISLHIAEREAQAEFDCAHATITQSIVLDKRGRFSVVGIYVEEHGGPVVQSERPRSYAVRFDGRIEGETMKLTITRTDTKEMIETFTLIHNQEPFIVKCR